MEKEFVTYEQALALKELGFDEPSIRFYWTDGLYSKSYNIPFNYNGKENSISVPTFSQAFRWFREKHGIIAFPIFARRIGYRFEISIDEGDSSCSTKFYNSHEEAELECLNKLIEIEIVNGNQSI